MKTLATLYNLLQVNRKIEDVNVRLLYLKDVWGLEQTVIGELEGVSQSYVSKVIIAARKKVSRETLEDISLVWTPDEIKYIHMLPRDILPDIPAIAFINNILGVNPIHGFFDYMNTNTNARIAGLAWLGVMNKRLMQLFGKNQSTISMVSKRMTEGIMKVQRINRYDHVDVYKLTYKPRASNTNKFIKAGGQE